MLTGSSPSSCGRLAATSKQVITVLFSVGIYNHLKNVEGFRRPALGARACNKKATPTCGPLRQPRPSAARLSPLIQFLCARPSWAEHCLCARVQAAAAPRRSGPFFARCRCFYHDIMLTSYTFFFLEKKSRIHYQY